MKPLIAALAAVILVAGCQTLGPAPSDNANTASARLDRLAKESRERSLDLDPVSETMEVGAGPRQGRLEMTFSRENRERQRQMRQWVLDELALIAPAGLAPSQKLSHALLLRQNRLELEGLQYPFHQHYVFIQLDGGVANELIRLVARQPFRNETDYRLWFARVERYPAYLAGVEETMRDGVRAQVTVPRRILERSLPQLVSLAPDAAEIGKSALWKPMTAFHDSIGAATRSRLEAEYRALLTTRMFPAIRRLAAFVRDEYMPRARASDGLGALPRGREMYGLQVRYQTTTELTPEEIHALGLKEAARIRPLLLDAGRKAGFTGGMKDLRAWEASDPKSYPFTTGEQVVEYLNRINDRIVPQLPTLFNRMPKTRLEIRLTDPAIAASVPAQWYPPTDDGTMPGIFAIPVVNPTLRTRVGLEALLAHEGMPGHHFDGSIAREVGLPEFRRHLWITAFGEGWALYAESLGHGLGLYDEPLALVGRYIAELQRACRLVLDTGLHAKDWTYDQALAYMLAECAWREAPARVEALRYMAWPGQALGYKIGELTIQDLRAQAERRLGSRFDIRRFHDAVLEEGHLPLSLLRERMEAWMREQ